MREGSNIDEVKENLNKLYSYIWHQEKYKEEFLAASKAKFFPYCIILIRKSLLLYIYEKFEQIHKLGEEEAFIEKWNNDISLKPKIDKDIMENFYFANTRIDEAVINFITKCYSIDQNYKKTLLGNSKAYRDAACHVSDTNIEKDITEEKIAINLKDTEKFVEEIEKSHVKNYFENLSEDLNWFQKLKTLHLSTFEKEHLLSRLIEFLKDSKNFDEAEEIESSILVLKDSIKPEHIERILDIVFQNNTSRINQILEARGGHTASRFLEKIFHLSKNKGIKSKWKNFFRKLLEQEYIGNKDEIVKIYGWLYKEISSSI